MEAAGFAVRNTQTTWYLGPLPAAHVPPSDLHPHPDPAWPFPIIRIFGRTPPGQSACVDVSGVFPYLLLPSPISEASPDWIQRFARVESGLRESLGGRGAAEGPPALFDVRVAHLRNFYGYEKEPRPFLRLLFLNPAHVKKAAELVESGRVMAGPGQPYEIHIPYVMQFFIDHSIYGMDYVYFTKVQFRRMPGGIQFLASAVCPVRKINGQNSVLQHPGISLSIYGTLNPLWLKEARLRMSGWTCEEECVTTCDVEARCVVGELARAVVGEGEGMGNPGLRFLWAEERARCLRHHLSPSLLSPPPSPGTPFLSLPSRPPGPPERGEEGRVEDAPSVLEHRAQFALWLNNRPHASPTASQASHQLDETQNLTLDVSLVAEMLEGMEEERLASAPSPSSMSPLPPSFSQFNPADNTTNDIKLVCIAVDSVNMRDMQDLSVMGDVEAEEEGSGSGEASDSQLLSQSVSLWEEEEVGGTRQLDGPPDSDSESGFSPRADMPRRREELVDLTLGPSSDEDEAPRKRRRGRPSSSASNTAPKPTPTQVPKRRASTRNKLPPKSEHPEPSLFKRLETSDSDEDATEKPGLRTKKTGFKRREKKRAKTGDIRKKTSTKKLSMKKDIAVDYELEESTNTGTLPLDEESQSPTEIFLSSSEERGPTEFQTAEGQNEMSENEERTSTEAVGEMMTLSLEEELVEERAVEVATRTAEDGASAGEVDSTAAEDLARESEDDIQVLGLVKGPKSRRRRMKTPKVEENAEAVFARVLPAPQDTPSTSSAAFSSTLLHPLDAPPLTSVATVASAPSSSVISKKMEKSSKRKNKRFLARRTGPKVTASAASEQADILAVLETFESEDRDTAKSTVPKDAEEEEWKQQTDAKDCLLAPSPPPFPGCASGGPSLHSSSPKAPAASPSATPSAPDSSEPRTLPHTPHVSSDYTSPSPSIALCPASDPAPEPQPLSTNSIALDNNVVVSVSSVAPADLAEIGNTYAIEEPDSYLPTDPTWAPSAWIAPQALEYHDSGHLSLLHQMETPPVEPSDIAGSSGQDLADLSPEQIEDFLQTLTEPFRVTENQQSRHYGGKDASMLEERAEPQKQIHVHTVNLVLNPGGSERAETALAVLNMEQEKAATEPSTIVVDEDLVEELQYFSDKDQAEKFLVDMLRTQIVKAGFSSTEAPPPPKDTDDPEFPWHQLEDPCPPLLHQEAERDEATEPNWVPVGPAPSFCPGQGKTVRESSEERMPPSLPQSPVKPTTVTSLIEEVIPLIKASHSHTEAVNKLEKIKELAERLEERPDTPFSTLSDKSEEESTISSSYALIKASFEEKERECRRFCLNWLESCEDFQEEQARLSESAKLDRHQFFAPRKPIKINCPPPKTPKSRGRPKGSKNTAKYVQTSEGIRIVRMPQSFRQTTTGDNEDEGVRTKRRGRPKGSLNKKTLLRLQIEGQQAKSSVSWGSSEPRGKGNYPDAPSSLTRSSTREEDEGWSGAQSGSCFEDTSLYWERPAFAMPERLMSAEADERLTSSSSSDEESDDEPLRSPIFHSQRHPLPSTPVPHFSDISDAEGLEDGEIEDGEIESDATPVVEPPKVAPMVIKLKNPKAPNRLALLKAQLKKRKLKL